MNSRSYSYQTGRFMGMLRIAHGACLPCLDTNTRSVRGDNR